MAAKKEPNIKDSILIFKDIINRCKIGELIYQNQTILSTKKDGGTVGFICGPELWNMIIEDEDMKSKLIPYNPMEHLQFKGRYELLTGMDEEGWMPISPEDMYSGELIELNIDGFEYTIPVNVRVFPIKLRKTEFTNFAYRATTNLRSILVVRKKFETFFPSTDFYMATPYQVI